MDHREQLSALQQLFYGHPEVPGRRDLENAWKAVKTIAAAHGPLTDNKHLFLLARMSAMGAPSEVVDTVMGWDARADHADALLGRIEVAGGVRWRTEAWIIYEGLSVAMADGELAPEELEAVCTAAASIGLSPETVDALTEVCREEAAIRRRRIEVLCSNDAACYRFDLL
jgi:hypothetical protein